MRSFMRLCIGAVLVLALSSSSVLVLADEYNHRYSQGDNVYFYVHKVGPYANPQEAYNYYSLPFCAPKDQKPPEKQKDKPHGLFNELRSNSIGEYLGGHSLRFSGHNVQYAPKQSDTESCTTPHPLTKEEAQQFINAAKNQWLYMMYLDDLPIWGMVGEMYNPNAKAADIDTAGNVDDPKNTPHVYTKRTIVIKYNKDRIIEVDLVSEPESLVHIREGIALTFETSFVWEPTTKEFHSRFDKYLDYSFFKHHIHWFSIFNSFMMVLFLSGLVALILVRTLRRDYAKYAIGDIEDGESFEEDEDGNLIDDDGNIVDETSLLKSNSLPLSNEDAGWKQVHGDVFRAPFCLPLFAAILGTGWQLIVLAVGVILFAIAGPLHGEVHEDRGEMQHAVIYCYCLSSIVAGYASGSYFKMYNATRNGGRPSANAGANAGTGTGASAGGKGLNGETQWQAAMFLTVMGFPTVIVGILSVLNGISLAYETVGYVPFLVIFKVLLLWIFISVPLCVLGTLAGRHAKIRPAPGAKQIGSVGCLSTTDFPCRVNAIARPIPEEVPWYGNPLNIIPFAGLLSFGSIFIELYYILTSIWNYKIYHVYGFLLGVFTILTIVVSMTTIIVVYFLLNAENYLWQWTAFFSGASTAAYVFLYGVYYFLFKTAMTGFLQTMFYFGYTTIIALTLATLCGTVAHFSASRFVRIIFQNVKID